jgi:hypothetical protein
MRRKRRDPPGARSLVHCHDESSCWVSLVEGAVVEVQYAPPPGMDDGFFARAMHDPDGAVGRCGPLRIVSAPSPVMEATNDEPTAFYIHRLGARAYGGLALMAPERIEIGPALGA